MPRSSAWTAVLLLFFFANAIIHCGGLAAVDLDEAAREAKIESLLTHVEDDYRLPCARILRGEPHYFAQAWQDWYLFHNLFSDRLEWGGGLYVDIGTNQPESISNTLFFDKCLGWRGVCVEPQEKYHEGIRARRSCTLVPRCIYSRHVSAQLEGIGGTAHLSVGTSGMKTCVTAESALAEAGLRGNEKIDFLSIDIEGFEAEALRCFPLDRHSVQAVLIEVNKQPRDHLQAWFLRHGYSLHEIFYNSALTRLGKPYISLLDHLYVRKERLPTYPRARSDLPQSVHDRAMRTTGSSRKVRRGMPWVQWLVSHNVIGMKPLDPGTHIGWRNCSAQREPY